MNKMGLSSSDLPDIGRLSEYVTYNNELFVCALGFEDRCVAGAKMLSELDYKPEHVVVLTYDTNPDDNLEKKPKLEEYLRQICSKISYVEYFYTEPLQNVKKFKKFLQDNFVGKINVTVDISSFSSSAVLQIINELIKNPSVETIQIIYAEAETYYPKTSTGYTNNEFLSTGLKDVITLPDFAGLFSVGYPHLLITFLGFSSTRARGVYNWYQPSRKIGIVGIPRKKELAWRVDLAKQIHENDYQFSDPLKEETTFDYKHTLDLLEDLYDTHSSKYNIGIASFGSKLQTLATLFFLKNHPDVQAIISIPKQFNSKSYSEGIGDVWRLELTSEHLMLCRK